MATAMVRAQTDYWAGYVISYSGDTISGSIDYCGDAVMGNVCNFKTIENSLTEYLADDLIVYRFTDGKYDISKEVEGSLFFLRV